MAHGLPGDSSSGYHMYLFDVLGKDKEEQYTLIKFMRNWWTSQYPSGKDLLSEGPQQARGTGGQEHNEFGNDK